MADPDDPPAENQKPVAVISGLGSPGRIAFDGRGSSDPDGSVIGYAWTLTGPNGAVDLGTNATASNFELTNLPGGSYTRTLVVTDNQGATSDLATSGVTIADPPPVTATILWVGTSKTESSLDRGIWEIIFPWLRARGYEVRLTSVIRFDDSDPVVQAAIAAADVVILDAASGVWANTWQNANKPVISMRSGISAPYLGMGTKGPNAQINAQVHERTALVHPASTVGAGQVQHLTSNSGQNYVTEISRHAAVLTHPVGQRFYPLTIVHERGEPMGLLGGTNAPARRVNLQIGAADRWRYLTEAGLQEIRDAVDWCVADPGSAIALPLLNIESSSTTTHTNWSITEASSTPAGRSIVARTFRLLNAAGAVVESRTVSTAESFQTATYANGYYQAQITITDDLGAVRTKTYALYAGLVTPVPGFSFVITDNPPSSNVITVTDSTDDRGVPIVRYDWTVYAADGTTVVHSLPNSEPSIALPGLANGSYVIRGTVLNDDGVSAYSEQAIAVPTPAVNSDLFFVEPVGPVIYAYGMAIPGRQDLSVTLEWDFDLANPGTLTAEGPHPGVGNRNGKPTVPSPGIRNGNLRINQSNGWFVDRPFSYETFARKEWQQFEDYTRPTIPAPGRSLFLAADASSDGDGSEGSPFKLLSSARAALQNGDHIFCTGNFRPQITGVNVTGRDDFAFRRWPGQPRPEFGAPAGNVVEFPRFNFNNCKRVYFEDVYVHGGFTSDVGKKQRQVNTGNCEDMVFLDSTFQRGHGVFFSGTQRVWFDNCDVFEIGTDVTIEDGNGGNGFTLYNRSNNATVVRSRFWRCGHVCILGLEGNSSLHARIAHNKIWNDWAGTIGPAGASEWLIERNDIYDVGWTEAVGQIGSRGGLNFRQDAHTARFNRLWNIERRLFQVQSQGNLRNNMRRNHAYHNTFYLNNQDGLAFAFVETNASQNGRLTLPGFCEDNLFENNLFVASPGKLTNNNRYQWWIDVKDGSADKWAIEHEWECVAPGVAAPHLAGNIYRHNGVNPQTPGQNLFRFSSPKGGVVGATFYPTGVEMQAAYPACVNNLMDVDPQFVSLDPMKDAGNFPTNPDFLRLSDTSPMINAGTPVPGIVYPPGVCPIGWDPRL